jgi:hypothetical protein
LLLLRLIGQKKPLFLQAESEADLDAWLTALTEAIGVSLNEQCSDLMQNQAVCLCVAATLLNTLVDCLFVCLFVCCPCQTKVTREQNEKVLRILYSVPGNTKCADCGASGMMVNKR